MHIIVPVAISQAQRDMKFGIEGMLLSRSFQRSKGRRGLFRLL